jgi:hypothetical protein
LREVFEFSLLCNGDSFSSGRLGLGFDPMGGKKSREVFLRWVVHELPPNSFHCGEAATCWHPCRGAARKFQVPSAKFKRKAKGVLGRSGARFKRGDHRCRGIHGVNPVATCLRPSGAGDRRGKVLSHPSYPSWSGFPAVPFRPFRSFRCSQLHQPFRVFRVFRGSLLSSEKRVARSEEQPGKDRRFQDARHKTGETADASRGFWADHGLRASRLAPGKRQQAARSPCTHPYLPSILLPSSVA